MAQISTTNNGVPLIELAELVKGDIKGDKNCIINSVASLENAKAGQISFLSNPRFKKSLELTKASAVILTEQDSQACPVNAIVVINPYVAYAKIATILHTQKVITHQIHSSAVIHDSATVHKHVSIGPNVVIEENVQIDSGVSIGPGCFIGRSSMIGENTRLEANVTICHGSRIGKRGHFHPGVVIGGDGFGIANDDGAWIKIPQIGNAIIGDDVEIGSNTTVDRGALGDTVIEDGVKLDNLIQIGHNVHVGAHTAMASLTGIAGSTKIGKYCTIGGAVGVNGHIEIADHVILTGMAMVTKSILEPGVYSSGIPAETNMKWHRGVARYKKLDEIAVRLRQIEKQLNIKR